MSISSSVSASCTTSRMHGGGVMGRRSCHESKSWYPILHHLGERAMSAVGSTTRPLLARGGLPTYLVSKATHSCPHRLLRHFQPTRSSSIRSALVLPRVRCPFTCNVCSFPVPRSPFRMTTASGPLTSIFFHFPCSSSKSQGTTGLGFSTSPTGAGWLRSWGDRFAWNRPTRYVDGSETEEVPW